MGRPGEALSHSFWLAGRDRDSTRLNSCHLVISYAVFCLKKNISRGCPSPPLHQRGWPPSRSPPPCCRACALCFSPAARSLRVHSEPPSLVRQSPTLRHAL